MRPVGLWWNGYNETYNGARREIYLGIPAVTRRTNIADIYVWNYPVRPLLGDYFPSCRIG